MSEFNIFYPQKWLFVFILLSVLTLKTSGQESQATTTNSFVTAGFGIMEVLNLGFDFENKDSEFGLKVGGLADDDEKLFSLTADYSYYFAGNSKNTGKRAWFGKIGIQYFSDKSDTFSEKATGIIARVGRKFYFSEKAGLKCDFGMFFRIHYKEYHKNTPFINFDWPIMPGMGISFFYKL